MRFLKILLFLVAFLVVWVLALRVVAEMGEGPPSDSAMLIASLIVLIPFLWLGRRLFRGEGSRRVSRIEEAAAAATAVGVAHTLPAVAEEGVQGDAAADSTDTDADID